MNNFDKSQSAHSTDVADSLSHNVFDWRRQPVVDKRTPEQIKASAHRSDMLKRYYARKAKEMAERVNPESVSGFSTGMALHRKEIRTELARAA